MFNYLADRRKTPASQLTARDIMKKILCTAAVVTAALTGCADRHPQADPMEPQAVVDLRQRYTQLDPQARVGRVTATLPEKGLVAVGDIAVREFAEGDILVFVDSANQVIAAGKVVAKTEDSLHLSYDLRGPNGREPQVGDAAVRTGR